MRHALALSIAALLLFPACSGDEGGKGGGKGGKGGEQQEQVSDPRVLVEVASVERGSVADYLITTGNLESEAQADISPEASGVITKVLVDEGTAVTAGQLLAVIDNPTLDASYERARLEHEGAKKALEEVEKLHDQGAISDRDLREARKLASAAATTFDEARQSRDFRNVRSPIAGTVSLRNVRVGEVANPGAPAFQVVDLDRLRVVVQLPEKDLPRVRQGQPVVLSGAYEEDLKATGQVTRISPVVDAVSGTVRVWIGVDPDQTALRPGQFVKVRLEVDRHDDVVTIPQRGLVYVDGEPVAWRLIEAPPEDAESEEEGEGGKDAKGDKGDKGDKGGFFAGLFGGGEDEAKDGEEEEPFDAWEGVPRRGVEKVRLEVGFTDPDHAEVISGLEPGELVVTVGNNALRSDTLVRLSDDPQLKEPPEDEGEAAEGADGEDGDDGAKG